MINKKMSHLSFIAGCTLLLVVMMVACTSPSNNQVHRDSTPVLVEDFDSFSKQLGDVDSSVLQIIKIIVDPETEGTSPLHGVVNKEVVFEKGEWSYNVWFSVDDNTSPKLYVTRHLAESKDPKIDVEVWDLDIYSGNVRTFVSLDKETLIDGKVTNILTNESYHDEARKDELIRYFEQAQLDFTVGIQELFGGHGILGHTYINRSPTGFFYI